MLLDRDREIGTFEAALSAARQGNGRVVVLEGSAGTGKSALLAAAGELAANAGMRVLSARGGELEQEHAFGVIRQLYEPPLTAASPAERERLLAGAAAPAARLLGIDEASDSGSYAAGFAAMNAVYWLTSALATDRPTLAIVDDAHWADASSLGALDYLARRLADLPLILAVGFRPDEPGARTALLDALRSAADMRLSPQALGRDSVAKLVRTRIPNADSEVCDACLAATAGNPLYVHELLRAVHINGSPLRPDEMLGTPVRFLGDRVLRRIERVDVTAPALARAMSVLGGGTRLATAAQLAGVSEREAGEIAHQLKRIEVLSNEDPIAFAHPLIRSSIYDTMADSDRQLVHRRAANLLRGTGASNEQVAAHLGRLTPAADPDVAQALAVAAREALGRAAPDEAVAWFERAVDEAAVHPEPSELLAELGSAKAMRRDPTAIGALQEAYELAGDPVRRVRLGVLLAEVLAHAGQWEASMDLIDALEHELDPEDMAGRTDLASIRAVATLFDPGRVADFDRRRDDYERLARLDYWGSYALAALLGAEAAQRGRLDEALIHGERARSGGRLLGEHGAGGWTSPHLLGLFILVDELDTASVVLSELDEQARASGSAFGLMTAVGYRAWIHARRGELTSAEATLITAFELARDAGLLMGLTTCLFLLIDVVIERSLTQFEEMIEGIELPPDFMATASGAMLLEARGRVRLARGEREAAAADLRAAGETVRTLRFGPTYSTWRSALALALPAEERDEARQLAEEELALARATGLARPIGIALRTLGVLQDRLGGIQLLRESVTVLESSPARLELARSLVELGAALRRGNQRSDAREPLVEGLRLAHACGAERLQAQADRELQMCGGRRPRLIATGRHSLTASELRVAELAASGASNAEIAQGLFVSLKTVETHLSHAYAKLGLAGPGSRGRLTAALDQATDDAILGTP
jgi:DNA-binding CsgD family transcriptional regulator